MIIKQYVYISRHKPTIGKVRSSYQPGDKLIYIEVGTDTSDTSDTLVMPDIDIIDSSNSLIELTQKYAEYLI